MLLPKPQATVGIRELKAHLSAFLARVEAGERLTVTDRGKPVATLAPIGAKPVPDWLDDLVGTGGARWAGGKPAGLARRVPARGQPASEMVLEDRR